MFPSQEKDMSLLTGQKLSVTREIDFWMSRDAKVIRMKIF